MKILSLNSSPRKSGQSKTEIMMNSLVDGMRAALYHFTVNASLKRFIERTLPVAKTEIRPSFQYPVSSIHRAGKPGLHEFD